MLSNQCLLSPFVEFPFIRRPAIASHISFPLTESIDLDSAEDKLMYKLLGKLVIIHLLIFVLLCVLSLNNMGQKFGVAFASNSTS